MERVNAKHGFAPAVGHTQYWEDLGLEAMTALIPIMIFEPPDSREYFRVLLKQYGRHKPGCPSHACSCGFEEIERELSR